MPYNTGNAELDKWLEEKVNPALSPEEAQVFQGVLGKQAVSEQIKRSFMAPPDYNRKMNELQEKERQLEQELQSYVNTLNNWRSTEQAKVDKTYADYQAAQAELASLRKQLNEEGIQPAATTPTAAQHSASSNGKPGGALTSDDITRMVQAELAKAAMLPAVTTQIVEQHRQLFGQVPDMTKVTDTALRTGRTLHDTWREMYKVSDREREINEASIQKKIEEGVAARVAQLQADGAMSQQNFGRPSGPPSPIRQMIAHTQQSATATIPGAPPVVPARLQQSEAVKDAEEAFRSGRYAVKYPGQS